MSSQHPQGQSQNLVICSFDQSMSTTNIVRATCGLLFILRFVTFSKHSNLRTEIHSKLVKLLDQQNLQHLSIDLVHFSWVMDDKEDEDNKDYRDDGEDSDIEDSNIKLSPYRTVITTPVTIWVGVLPDTLTGEITFKSSNDILDLLKEHGISDINIVYHELVARSSSGPKLFAPALDHNPLKAIIHPMTTTLSLSIAGLKHSIARAQWVSTSKWVRICMLSPACHILFPENLGNNTYTYVDMFFSPER